MNYDLSLFLDNESLYNQLKYELESRFQKSTFQLLKHIVPIYTREKISGKYYQLRLVSDNVPSLGLQFFHFKSFLEDLFLTEKSKDSILSNQVATLMLAQSIKQRLNTNFKFAYSQANLVLAEYIESIIRQTEIPTSYPYQQDIEFLKSTRNSQKLFEEYVLEMHSSSKMPNLKNFMDKYGNEIYIIGRYELDELSYRVFDLVSKKVDIKVFLTEPFFELLNEKANSLTVSDVLPEKFIVYKKYFNKKIIDLQQKQILHNSESIKKQLNQIQFHFIQAPEIYREIDFVAKNILNQISENESNPNFLLTSIKIAIPQEMEYVIGIKNSLDSYHIPFALSTEINIRIAPYYSAVLALIELTNSNFDPNTAFSLFYNPCFYPKIMNRTYSIQADIWWEISNQLNINEFLDKKHRKEQEFREVDLLTWQSLWLRMSKLLTNESKEDWILDEETREAILPYIIISSSLFNDLIYWKQANLSILEHVRFFRILVQTYLSHTKNPSLAENDFLNSYAYKRIMDLLNSLESTGDTLSHFSSPNLKFYEFTEILLNQLQSMSDGSHDLLKRGVVVGTLRDTLESSFCTIYVLGLDERRLPSRILPTGYLQSEQEKLKIQIENKVHSLYYFQSILKQNPKQIFLSYVYQDTIKDRPYYESNEIKRLWKYISGSDQVPWIRLPLYDYQEWTKQEIVNYLKWSPNSIKRYEKLYKMDSNFQTKIPDWKSEENTELYSVFDELSDSIYKYLNRKHSEVIENKNVSINSISIQQLFNYIKCPKKFLVENVLSLEEIDSIIEETFSISSLNHAQFTRKLVHTILDTELNQQELLSIIFNRGNRENGSIPSGILELVTKESYGQFLNNLYEFITSLKYKYKIYKSIRLEKNNTSISTQITVESPNICGLDIYGKIDYLFLNGNLAMVGSITTAKRLNPTHQVKSILDCMIIKHSPNINEFIGDRVIVPMLIHISLDKKFDLITFPEITPQIEQILEQYIEKCKTNIYPMSPFTTENCSYCNIKHVCNGFQFSYEEFLDNTELIEYMNRI